jgi:molybdopterin/thiamine biosynthesis adenylyltransferase/rhodanese-related sulfurtransferase
MLKDLSSEEILRYSRHLMIPEVGIDGQPKLKNASVLLVGAGGLGSPIGLYLAAAGVGHIGIVDYDRVEMSNLQRQIAHGMSTLGTYKSESARSRMHDINPSIQIDTYNVAFTSENARSIADGYEILVDGTDNFPTRYLINDLCVFTKKPFVFGGVHQFEGQVSVFDAQSGPCYRCIFKEPPPPELAPSCGDIGVFGIMPGIVGLFQASETIKLILGLGQTLAGFLVLIDAMDMTFHKISIERDPHCKVCSPESEITDLIDYTEFCGVPFPGQVHQAEVNLEITPLQLSEKLKSGAPIRLIDVRQEVETHISSIPGAELIPFALMPQQLSRLDPDDEIVVYCRTGNRSGWAQSLLLRSGFHKVWNLRGGINAWAREVDPSMAQY